MDDFKEGSVVVVSTGQAGTISHLDGMEACVLLRNMELWHGMVNRLHFPQSQQHLDACPINVERVEEKRVIHKNKFD